MPATATGRAAAAAALLLALALTRVFCPAGAWHCAAPSRWRCLAERLVRRLALPRLPQCAVMVSRRRGRGAALAAAAVSVLVMVATGSVSAGQQTASQTPGCTNALNVTAPCGPGNDQCDAASPLELGLGFHIFGGSCDINDPNGMFYDASTKLYHLFFQDHLGLGEQPGGGGRVWGHLVSHDLVRWARLPVALWNDHAYDNVAIYSGSATIVDGVPTQLYPGICSVNAHAPSAACASGVNLVVAVPADRSDPLLQNWSKPGYNPVAGNVKAAPPASGSFSCGDPSAAWRTTAGKKTVFKSHYA